ncbi:MAG TPA: hypothetical protein HA224_04970 [Nanoarchaeota archaeon]|nr:hypothetical protein [Nanoarchaeota archaeon]
MADEARHLITHGDADGLTAAYQVIMRRCPYEVHTAGKRQVDLVNIVASEIPKGADVVILDLSSKTNAHGLETLLANGAKVEWIDHHTQVTNLETKVNALGIKVNARINEDKDYCTSLIVNELTKEKYVDWAIAGAFGDNKRKKAKELAKKHGISADYLAQLQEVGRLLNYNSFAIAVNPNEVLAEMLNHKSPKTFACSEVFKKIKQQYAVDRTALAKVNPVYDSGRIVIYQLPDIPSSTAMLGDIANEKQAGDRSKMYFVIAPDGEVPGKFVMSIRTSGNPLASDIAKLFEKGGGRADAAGASITSHAKPEDYILQRLKDGGFGN